MTTPIKFLLVDDTPENLIALEALLRRDGLECITARSGTEALELLLVHDIALALLDVQMPGIDGFELAELMRGTERTKHIPIILVTAGARDPGRVFRGYESGAVDFLSKPIEPHVLRSKAAVFFDLARKSAELSHALRINEMFIGVVGHDLRNPLSALMTGAQLLDTKITDEVGRRVVKRMLSAGQRMAGMIDQVLDLTRARIGGGLMVRDKQRTDIVELVHRAIDELRGAHAEREIGFEHRDSCVIDGDPGRLLQLFSNLIGNALVHGTPNTAVMVRAEGGVGVVVTIDNHGEIPADLLPQIFDPFRGRRSAHGLGLGLYISREIAVAHGGNIEVASSPAGTTFRVRLPA